MTYLWATLLLFANLLSWASTFFMVPGNWLILLFTVLYLALLPDDAEPRISVAVVVVTLVLAVLGEVVEALAGAAGAAQQGGSRRGMVLAIAGAFLGSLAGAVIGVPVPVIGPVIAALIGGAGGAFAGAYVGEFGLGREHHERVGIGKAAFFGRLFGTAGKLVIGALMVVIVTLDAFFDL